VTASARTAVDPHAVICELVAAVEPDLPPGTVHAAIDQAVRFKAAAVRLAQVLDGDPGLLTSGRPEGPASVERLIRLLQEGGAVRVVRPPCSLCGKLAPLTGTHDSGLRICSSCGNYRTRAKGSPAGPAAMARLRATAWTASAVRSAALASRATAPQTRPPTY